MRGTSIASLYFAGGKKKKNGGGDAEDGHFDDMGEVKQPTQKKKKTQLIRDGLLHFGLHPSEMQKEGLWT